MPPFLYSGTVAFLFGFEMIFNSEKAKRIFPGKKYETIRKVFSREGLSVENRLLCSISFLQAVEDIEFLKIILDLYINKDEELRKAYEVLSQGYLFYGYPKAIESFFCLNEVLQKKDKLSLKRFKPLRLKDDDALLEKGETIAKRVHKEKFEIIRNKISDFCPDLGYLMIAEGYGHILSRDSLSIKLRELAVAYSSLTALGASRQLYSHIRGARNVGCGDLEIYEVIITGSIWVSYSKIESSLILWSKITGKKPIDSFNDFQL